MKARARAILAHQGKIAGISMTASMASGKFPDNGRMEDTQSDSSTVTSQSRAPGVASSMWTGIDVTSPTRAILVCDCELRPSVYCPTTYLLCSPLLGLPPLSLGCLPAHAVVVVCFGLIPFYVGMSHSKITRVGASRGTVRTSRPSSSSPFVAESATTDYTTTPGPAKAARMFTNSVVSLGTRLNNDDTRCPVAAPCNSLEMDKDFCSVVKRNWLCLLTFNS